MITAAADGSSLANPGPSGWAWYIDEMCWAAGGWPHGTNNMGELMAVLDLLRQTSHIDDELLILCDSQYVINSITTWMPGWKKKGWKKADGKPVLNLDLLQELDQAMAGRQVRFEWVKGHAGHDLNEAADERARAAATAFRDNTDVDHGPGFGDGPTPVSVAVSAEKGGMTGEQPQSAPPLDPAAAQSKIDQLRAALKATDPVAALAGTVPPEPMFVDTEPVRKGQSGSAVAKDTAPGSGHMECAAADAGSAQHFTLTPTDAPRTEDAEAPTVRADRSAADPSSLPKDAARSTKEPVHGPSPDIDRDPTDELDAEFDDDYSTDTDELDAEDQTSVLEREFDLVSPDIRQNPHAFGDLLHADLVVVAPNGRTWNRDQMLAAPAASTAPTLEIISCDPVDASTVLVVSRVAAGSTRILRSSLWVFDDTWRLRFQHNTTL